MTEGVVDDGEPVDIDEDEREGSALRHGLLQCKLGRLEKRPPVRNAGEIVSHRGAGQRLFGGVLLREIHGYADRSDDRSRFITHRIGEHMKPLAVPPELALLRRARQRGGERVGHPPAGRRRAEIFVGVHADDLFAVMTKGAVRKSGRKRKPELGIRRPHVGGCMLEEQLEHLGCIGPYGLLNERSLYDDPPLPLSAATAAPYTTDEEQRPQL